MRITRYMYTSIMALGRFQRLHCGETMVCIWEIIPDVFDSDRPWKIMEIDEYNMVKFHRKLVFNSSGKVCVDSLKGDTL